MWRFESSSRTGSVYNHNCPAKSTTAGVSLGLSLATSTLPICRHIFQLTFILVYLFPSFVTCVHHSLPTFVIPYVTSSFPTYHYPSILPPFLICLCPSLTLSVSLSPSLRPSVYSSLHPSFSFPESYPSLFNNTPYTFHKSHAGRHLWR